MKSYVERHTAKEKASLLIVSLGVDEGIIAKDYPKLFSGIEEPLITVRFGQTKDDEPISEVATQTFSTSFDNDVFFFRSLQFEALQEKLTGSNWAMLIPCPSRASALEEIIKRFDMIVFYANKNTRNSLSALAGSASENSQSFVGYRWVD